MNQMVGRRVQRAGLRGIVERWVKGLEKDGLQLEFRGGKLRHNNYSNDDDNNNNNMSSITTRANTSDEEGGSVTRSTVKL